MEIITLELCLCLFLFTFVFVFVLIPPFPGHRTCFRWNDPCRAFGIHPLGPCSRQSSSSCSQMQMFLTRSNPDRGETISMIHDWTKLMAVASNHVFWHVETIFTSGLLIFVLAPDISTIILAFLHFQI